MTKKLFVPDRVATGPLPKAVEKAFASAEEDKNSVDPSTMEESAMDRLPQPVGYRLLVIPYYMAAKDQNKFPTGAWCEEKSWVLIGRYAGNRFKVDGLEVRLINDDNIIATILDPSDISYV